MARERKSNPITGPADSAPAAVPMPWAPWRVKLLVGLYSYAIGKLLRDLTDIAMTQGYRRGALLAPEVIRVRVHPAYQPGPGSFCPGTGGPACFRALNDADRCPGDLCLGPLPESVDLAGDLGDTPQTD